MTSPLTIPVTCDPVIEAYVRTLDDLMPEDQRPRLHTTIPLLGESAGAELEHARILAWAAVAIFAPIALDAAGQEGHADALRAVSKYDWTAARAAAEAVDDALDGDAGGLASRAAAAAAHYALLAEGAIRTSVYYYDGVVGVGRAAAEAAGHAHAWDLALAALKQASPEASHD